MGEDKIRHLLSKKLATGEIAYFWNPSKTLRRLGLTAEALGTIESVAKRRAIELNGIADEVRRGARKGSNGSRPDSLSRMITTFTVSEEFAELRPRTQRDYRYYLEKIDLEFGSLPAAAITARVIKQYYRRVRRESGTTWAYHIMGSLRAAMSWAVSENWLGKNPALDVVVKSPPRRTVKWDPDQAKSYIEKAYELGWTSVAVMAYVFDSTAQRPSTYAYSGWETMTDCG